MKIPTPPTLEIELENASTFKQRTPKNPGYIADAQHHVKMLGKQTSLIFWKNCNNDCLKILIMLTEMKANFQLTTTFIKDKPNQTAGRYLIEIATINDEAKDALLKKPSLFHVNYFSLDQATIQRQLTQQREAIENEEPSLKQSVLETNKRMCLIVWNSLLGAGVQLDDGKKQPDDHPYLIKIPTNFCAFGLQDLAPILNVIKRKEITEKPGFAHLTSYNEYRHALLHYLTKQMKRGDLTISKLAEIKHIFTIVDNSTNDEVSLFRLREMVAYLKEITKVHAEDGLIGTLKFNQFRNPKSYNALDEMYDEKANLQPAYFMRKA